MAVNLQLKLTEDYCAVEKPNALSTGHSMPFLEKLVE